MDKCAKCNRKSVLSSHYCKEHRKLMQPGKDKSRNSDPNKKNKSTTD